MKAYEYLEHTADAEFLAYGKDFKELLENAAKAMLNLIYNMKKVEGKTRVQGKADGKNQEELLHNFLAELLYLSGSKEMVFAEVKVLKAGGSESKAGSRREGKSKIEGETKVEFECLGEGIDSKKHDLKSEVKAVSYHNLKIVKENGLMKARVLVDL